MAHLVKNQPAMQETCSDPWVGKTPWRRAQLPTPVLLGFPGSSAGKESTFNAGDMGSLPGSGRCRLPTPVFLGFPGGSVGKESAGNAGRPGFDPWVGKIPWRRERLPTPVFWPGEFHGLYHS